MSLILDCRQLVIDDLTLRPRCILCPFTAIDTAANIHVLDFIEVSVTRVIHLTRFQLYDVDASASRVGFEGCARVFAPVSVGAFAAAGPLVDTIEAHSQMRAVSAEDW